MRICLYTDTALPKMGGQEWVVDALARQFQGLNHEVVVLAPHPRLPLRARDHELPYPVVRHPRFYSTRFFVSWYRWFLKRLHARQHSDVLHCHGVYPAGYLAALTRRERGIPTVITSHGGDIHPRNVRLAKPALRPRILQSLQTADALVSISRYTEENLRLLCPQARCLVSIPNGVDLSPYARPVERPAGLDPLIQPGEYFLFLGRLKERKGVDVLLEAMAQWRPEGPPRLQLVLAGDGQERDALEKQCARLGLSQRVRFVGAVYHPAKAYLLQNAACTVVSSRVWEAFPLVVLESYAAGRAPVLGTRIPGLEDLIEPHQTGWLAPPEAPAALAALLQFVWDRRPLLRPMREHVRQLALDYSWESIAQRHLELYEGLIAQNEVRRAG